MPAPNIPLPPTLAPLHLYRHLLREVSYLPPIIRPYFASFFRHRFRRIRSRPEPLYGTPIERHQKKGLRALRVFRAANSGDKAAMRDVILRGLGRFGIRRRTLFNDLRTMQGPDNAGVIEKALEAAEQGGSRQPDGKPEAKPEDRKPPKGEPLPVANPTIRPKNSWLAKWDITKLKKWTESQITQHGRTKSLTSWPSSQGKSSDDTTGIPDLNIWGKPLHPGRIETRRAMWWKRMANKTMPPLEPAEFEALKRLSDGAQRVDGHLMIPSRRPLARQLSEDVQEGLDWDLEAHATQSAVAAERPKMVYRLRSGRGSQGPYTKSQDFQDCSDRYFRRQYKRAFLITPNVTQNPNTLKHTITWGSFAPKASQPTKTQMAIFENLPDMSTKKGKKKAP